MLTNRDQQYVESEVRRIAKFLQQEAGPGMDKFSEISEHLYVSNWNSACNPQYLKDKDIELVICVSKDSKSKSETKLYKTMRIHQISIPIEDNQNENITRFFEQFYRTLYDAILKEQHILVHCETGASTSVALVLYYLLKRYYLTNFGKKASLDKELMSPKMFKLKDIITYIKARRTCIDPNLGFVTQLLTAEMFLKKQITSIYNQTISDREKKKLQRDANDADNRVKSRKKVHFDDEVPDDIPDDISDISFESSEGSLDAVSVGELSHDSSSEEPLANARVRSRNRKKNNNDSSSE
jgi:hypothetical protein